MQLQRFTPDGQELARIDLPPTVNGGARKAGAIGVDADRRRVYVTDHADQEILGFDFSGQLTHRWGRLGDAPGELLLSGQLFLSKLAVDEQGNIWIADTKYQERPAAGF